MGSGRIGPRGMRPLVVKKKKKGLRRIFRKRNLTAIKRFFRRRPKYIPEVSAEGVEHNEDWYWDHYNRMMPKKKSEPKVVEERPKSLRAKGMTVEDWDKKLKMNRKARK